MTQKVPNTKINWKSRIHNHSHCYMLKQTEKITKAMVIFGEKKKVIFSFFFLCPPIKFSSAASYKAFIKIIKYKSKKSLKTCNPIIQSTV